ncbi:hypothetical protein Patl1_16320 [Pistacia atlantica]|uniref:Uncharacterized protein n=1 Tax=Pistacia atlantica TaxID=434234 RepID=A0ACC1B7J4_9ROSI|nr:hypothetical protein Patl1_16320 [Pistacia atlantica]
MHMQVLHNNKIIIFDRTDSGPSNISLPANKCRLNDEILKPDCTSHSVLYDIASNTFRPLMVLTDTWCSSGAVDRDGTLVQTDDETSDWVELKKSLWDRRWYASNQILPDNRIIIVGGRKVFTYEFYPKNESLPSSYYLPFLIETRDPEENNLYPFLHLLPDGNLFIFANRRSILFDYVNNKVVKEFPVIPGNDKRSYPSTGSSVLLPLRNLTSGFPEAEVMVCGGAPPGAFLKSQKERVFVVMPMPRVMTDMILLPTGEVILINGATNGTAGWENGANPNLNPVLYLPNQEPPLRFLVLNPSKIPRMYHSSAVLVPDGRILVGGSNPHARYNFTAYPYPTELSLEAFYPHYLSPLFESIRPSILTVESTENRTYKVVVIGPNAATVAPPGYYMIFVVHSGIPSPGVWIKVM